MKYTELPVYRQKQKILDALSDSQVIVVESPTGSGKTTQLPVILHEAGYTMSGVIGITQPRRIATLSVSDFISRQLDEKVGEFIGYKMRFEDRTSVKTRLKIMTDGILLQEMKHDPLLLSYNVIIVDEAHERSLNIDFILGLLKNILSQRSDFKIIISSATINADIFSTYFSGCPVIHIDTKMFPVEIKYMLPPESEEDLVFSICSIVDDLLKNNHKGDILVFLSGEKIIKETILALNSTPQRSRLEIIPLYGRLSKEEQERVFIPAEKDKIKVIVSTNIAETSVTIDGITAVIDSGLAKVNYYNPRTFTASLREEPISRASGEQRKGRAGRTQPGICFRLYSRDDFLSRNMYTLEEIYRTDLSEVVLRMAELGIKDYSRFDFISSPGKEGILGAVETLKTLDALDEKNELTATGLQMFPYPLLPIHSRIIIESIQRYPEVLLEITIIVAFISTHTPFLLPIGDEFLARKAHNSFRDNYGDFISYLKIYRAFRNAKNREQFCDRNFLDYRTMAEISNITDQLQDIVSEQGIPISGGGSIENILKSVSSGLIQFVCIKTGRNTYRSITADRIQIHPGSVLFKECPEYIVAGEIVRTSKIFARSVSMLEKKWINDIKPGLLDMLNRKHGKSGITSDKRDTSWKISIGDISLKLVPFKGKKKLAVIEWEKIKTDYHNINYNQISQYSRLRAVFIFHGKQLIRNDKLSRILLLLKNFDPDKNFIPGISRSNFSIFRNPEKLASKMDDIFKITVLNRKNLGFTALETDGRGTFWFKTYGSYINALESSLESIDYLIEEVPNESAHILSAATSKVFRRLSLIYDTVLSD